MMILTSIGRRGPRINGDCILKQQALKTQAFRRVCGHAPPGNVLDFNSLKSPFLGFCVILKNLADFCKTVETGMDPHLNSVVKLL